MEISLYGGQRHIARLQVRRLVLPFLIALLLHVLVLFQFGMKAGHGETRVSPSLTVRLMVEPAHTAAVRQTRRAAPPASEETVLAADASDARLDMNLIRSQASAYARESAADSEPALSMEGDYYGSYSGDDSGVFYVHLSANGHASGTGQSHSISIPFLISGDVDKQGMIAMQGSGIAGEARFTGQLNIADGTVSGRWNVPGFMKGSFSARRDAQRSAQSGF